MLHLQFGYEIKQISISRISERVNVHQRQISTLLDCEVLRSRAVKDRMEASSGNGGVVSYPAGGHVYFMCKAGRRCCCFFFMRAQASRRNIHPLKTEKFSLK